MQADSTEFGREFERFNRSPIDAGSRQMPLFHAAWLFAAGIAAAHWLSIQPSFVLIAIVLTASLCVHSALHAPRIVWIPLSLLWFMLGAWCATMEVRPAMAQPLASLSDGLLRTVEGTVVHAGPVHSETIAGSDMPDESDDRAQPTQRVDLRVATLEQVSDTSDEQIPIAGGVRLTVRWPLDPANRTPPQAFQCGDHIHATARLVLPQDYHDPGVWSREDFLLDQGITATATVNIDRVETMERSHSASLACHLSQWQHASTARLLALPLAMRRLPAPLRLSEQDAAMIAAMIAGDRTYLTHSLRVGFERTGSFHMLVVSGFHLAIVAACIFWFARLVRLPPIPATLLTIVSSFAYALFTGFATPVQRSLWMVTLYLLARLVYRGRSPLNTIGFAALCLLAISPRSLFDAGLQMTLLAVVAIAGVAAPLLQSTVHPYLKCIRDLRLIAIDCKLPPRQAQFRVTLRMFAAACDGTRYSRFAWSAIPLSIRSALRLTELLVVSCVVELAMTLPMALYFHRITLFALPVNLFILPLLLLLMPAALVTLLISFVSPSAAALPGLFVAVLLHCGLWLVHLFGSLALGDFRIPGPLLISSAAFCAGLIAAMLLARGNKFLRRCAWIALFLAAYAAIASRPIDHPKNALLMEAIDVGQGDSLLLITPDGKSLLVDGGGFGGNPHQTHQEFDIGEEVVSATLWSRGIRRLDAVALTHAHSDHMGGLPAVLRNFHPRELWVGNNPHFAAYDALLDEAAALGTRVRPFRAGDALAFGNTRISVFAPMRDYEPGLEPTNNDSLVMRMAYGSTSVLLEGDAEAPVENAMLTEPGLESSLLKVGHHGSITSTRPAFLVRVAPQWAVISCGLHNRYGHPHPQVLAELERAGVKTFSTDLNGAVCFNLDGKSVHADPRCGWQRGP